MIATSLHAKRIAVIYFVAAVASIIISFWISAREVVINPDAICYVLSAQTIGTLGIQSAMHLCPQAVWPFYSLLIYHLSQVVHLSLTSSAFLIDGLLTFVSVCMFIAIVQSLGASQRVLWYAAAVILLSHEFNAVREYIVRDHGFWAFYLASIFLLIRFMREPSWLSAIGWSASLLIATLFRIEGAVFLVFMPFITLLDGRIAFSQRAYRFTMLSGVTILLIVGVVTWYMLHRDATANHLGRLAEFADQVRNGFSMMLDRYYTMQKGMIEHVLPKEAARDVNVVLFITLVTWYLSNVIGNLSLIFTLLVLYALASRAALWTRASTLVIVGYLLINLMITAIFFAEHLFLAKRYLIAFSLIFMFWVPFALDKLQRKAVFPTYKKAFALSIAMVAMSALGGLFEFGYSKSYVRDAGDWLAINVPANASLYANDMQLMFYSRHFDGDIFAKLPVYRDINTIADKKWKQYDYLALRMSKKREPEIAAVIEHFKMKPIANFKNKRGDQVLVYQVPRGENAV